MVLPRFWLALSVLVSLPAMGEGRGFVMLPLVEGAGLATDNTWIGYALADSVSDRSASARGMPPVAHADVEAATERLGRPLRLVRGAAEALSVAADLGCEFIGLGGFRVEEADVVVDVAILDVASREPVIQQSLRGPADHPADLADRLLARALAGMGLADAVAPPLGPEWDSVVFLSAYGDALALMDDARAASGRGMSALATQRLTECIDALGRAIDAAPSADSAYDALERACTWALELDPSSAGAWANLALVHEHRGELDLAVSELWSAVRAAPGDVRLRARLGCALVAYSLTQDQAVRGATLDQAQDALRSAVAMDPDDHVSQYGMGLAYYHRGRYSEATEAFSIACDLAPNLAEPWYALGLALREPGRVAEARAALERALERASGELAGRIRTALGTVGVQ